ncbi:MAG: hypothetical protein LBL96_10845 [Clostridiales bacterium]|nr:hypothetical protein [Clostridiales bacterium]
MIIPTIVKKKLQLTYRPGTLSYSDIATASTNGALYDTGLAINSLQSATVEKIKKIETTRVEG